MQPDFPQFAPLLLAAVVVFAVYRRLRRSFGRQILQPARMTARIVLLVVVGCALLPLALRSAQFLSAELIGALLGIGLGMWGAERTRFLMYGERLHYVPHTYTGIAVSLLFLGRMAFRFVQQYTSSHAVNAATATQAAPSSMVKSPLTAGIFFVLVGYYVCFYSLVLWKSKRLDRANLEVVSAPSTP
jgi:hypothetical protein